jgi:hypothetical protein
MTTAISSAGPTGLQRYVAVSAAQAEPMAHEAAMLAATLSAFSAACTEYRTPAIDGLAARMSALEARAGELGGWVAAVAAGFVAADGGALNRRHSGLRPPQHALRNGFQIRINGPLGITIDARFPARSNAPARLATLPLFALGVWFTGTTPLLAPAIAYTGISAAQRWLIAQTQAPWFSDLRRGVGALLTAAGITLQALTMAASQLHAGRLITPANSIRAVRAALRATGLETPLRAAAGDATNAAWSGLGLALLLTLKYTNHRMSGSVPVQMVMLPDLLADIAPILLVAGSGVVLLSTLGDGRNWHQLPPGDGLPALLQRAFWIESQAHVSPPLLRAITVEAEALNRTLAIMTGAGGNMRPEPLRRDHQGRVLEVDFAAAFPEEQRIALPDGTYALRPGALMSGEQRIISYYRNEQVTLVRLNADDFVVGICGLDPQNMAFAPNGLSAVIDTAYTADSLRNAYYQYVREEFLRYIERIPPGSNLHLAGHSMGGGMAIRLLRDPAVIAALAARDLTPQSLTTVGAVRPESAPGRLPPGLIERHYVDPDDQLAMNVGAGHPGYSGVVLIDDGALTAPVTAHSGYADADYETLPVDLGLLPYTVDPAHYAVYRLDPIGYQPVEILDVTPPLYP